MSTIYVIAIAALLAIGVATGASVQGLRLDAVRAELTAVQSDLDAANVSLDRVSREKAVSERVLAAERDKAVTAERQASSLREQIARDAGTDRDAQTAPVLRDAIRGLQRTGSRADAFFLGRMPARFRLVVTVDGRITATATVRGFIACRDLAANIATGLSARPELVANPRRASIRCQPMPNDGERA